ncbi:MAG: glycoside hydrolase family 9 protein [Sphaerotilus natans subsp. sulfidivorans]|uniref:glycoside hydrolase family 9 protein n=1 Tax=Sphaerotilus sulfidivorans TaxID=639200 RepID=UPI0023562B3A|nr:glycoside hydrolase family 9 protein [Sphaerotilus sulfidivorans]MCK6401758.1 glycoside hydrolase family 9 protein [Sphaerotilus sulfidivorans]
MNTMFLRPRACVGLLLLLGAGAAPAVPSATVPWIKVDQFGYQPAMQKVAVIVDPQAGFNAAEAFAPGTGSGQYQIRRWADDVVVHTGTLQPWKSGATHAQSGDRGWHYDFSALTAAGAYYVWDSARQVGSGRFEIGSAVYAPVLRHAVRMFYHQRLNHAKVAPYVDARWADAAAYERPGQDRSATSRWAKGQAATARDLSGGWMDAGDTNKYVTFAQSAVLQLLDAYRMSPAVFRDDFGIPESGNGLPDLLDELKWELDFLRRMQDASGTHGLFLKVGVDSYTDISPPSADARPRHYLPECTSATLAGAAMFGAAHVVYRGFASQAAGAADLLARAEAAWARAKLTTSGFTVFQTACDDGDIKAGDADVDAQGQLESSVLAAIALYEATGKAEYRAHVEANYARVRPYNIWWWGPYWAPMQVALLRHAGQPGVSASVASSLRSQKSWQSGVISLTDFNGGTNGTDLYRAHLADAEFNWGHNMTRSNAGLINLDFEAFGINSTSAALYRRIAEQHLHWLHGANPMGLVMLSNMASAGAESSLSEIYHTWFANGTVWDSTRTSARGPAPGYLAGGPNTTYTGSVAGLASQPPQKAYKDWNTGWPENSWEVTEPAIYYQAAYVQLLARLMGTADTQAPTAPSRLTASAITRNSATLSWSAGRDNVGVVGHDLYSGSTLLGGGLLGTSRLITGLSCNTSYTLTLRARDLAGQVSAASTALTLKTAACS